MSAKNPHENQDEHSFRNVAVWLIPLVFFVPFTIVFSAHDVRVVIWSAVSAVIIFLVYALFLLEWYVWKQNPARSRARIVFICFCAAVIAGGIFWPRTVPPTPLDSIRVHLPPGLKLQGAINYLAQQESFTATFGVGCSDLLMKTEVEEADLAGGSIVALIELLPRHLKKPPLGSGYRVVRVPEKGIYEITCTN